MAKQKRPDPLIEALNQKIPFTFTIADGGDLASMRKAVKHGQTLTFSSVADPAAIQAGDIVLVKWHGGTIIHLVGEVCNDQFLIINSLGKENGWVTGDAILGYVSDTIEPDPRPAVPQMLDQLEDAYRIVIDQSNPSEEERARLLAIAADMRWYAATIGSAQWVQPPRLNLWSFEQHLWHLMKKARHAITFGSPDAVRALLNDGKEHVGRVATIFRELEAANSALLTTDGKKRTSVTIRNFQMDRDLVPLVNLRNLIAGTGEQPITIAQQRKELNAPNQQPSLDRWVAEEIGDSWMSLLGQAFGYHTVPERYLAWVEVHPDWRRRGIGSALLAQVLERAKSLGVEHILINAPADAGEGNEAAHPFLQQHGFWAKSNVWFMQAPADLEAATPQWPEGYTIRSFAEVQDLAILWQVCYQSYGEQWGHGENSRINREKPPETTMAEWLSDDDPQGENFFLAFDEQGDVAGICRGFVGERKTGTLPTGLIDAPGVVPKYRHLELQRPLTLTVMQWLRARGQGALELSSFGDSLATVELYREVGFVLEQHFIAYHLDISDS